jgi:hypothetical protein
VDLSNKVILRNEDIAWRVIDGEALLVDPKDSLIYPLNGVATRIWGLLEEKNSCQEIIAVLEEEFAGEKAMMREDVLDFIKDLLEKGLALEKT